MYVIKSEKIFSFIKDNKIKLPRFQRKATWKGKDNFELLISVFKNYPIGVSIIDKQVTNDSNYRYLLDGRQRRNALKETYRDPELIYKWALPLIKIDDLITGKSRRIKKTDSDLDIQDAYWKYIYEYLNQKDEDGFEKAVKQALKEGLSEFNWDGVVYDTSADLLDDNESESISNLTEDLVKQYSKVFEGKLDQLCNIIITIHKNSFEKFNLKKYIKDFEDSDLCTNKGKINIPKLTVLLEKYIDTAESQDLDLYDLDNFIEFLTEEKFNEINKEEKVKRKLKKYIDDNTNDLNDVIKSIYNLKENFSQAELGIIETQGITTTDSQMIFTLINNSGMPLSAVEILSARPAWNLEIKGTSSSIIDSRKPLYDAIGGMKNTSTVVAWDYPATLFKRLKNFEFLFPNDLEYTNPTHLQKIITLGFKILAGIYLGGVTKEKQNLLSKKKIKWKTDIDELISELNKLGEVLSGIPYFAFLKSYKKNLMSLTSDAVALNFLFLVLTDYRRKGKPSSGVQYKNFIHNTQILVDQLIYEYVTEKWRGSGDSKIARNILDFPKNKDRIIIQSRKNWNTLIKDINDNYKIDDKYITFSNSKVLLYHIYAINGKSGPNNQLINIDTDHIIPQASFRSSSIAEADYIRHALFNLTPLPSKQNKKKSSKPLADIKDSWLIQNINDYSFIEQKDFKLFSNVSSYKNLRTKRRDFFETKFLDNRDDLFNN